MQAHPFTFRISPISALFLSAGFALMFALGACGISSVGSAPNDQAAQSTTDAGNSMSGDTADSSAEAATPGGDAECDSTNDILCGIPDFPLDGGTTWGKCMACLRTSCGLNRDSCNNNNNDCNGLAFELLDCLARSSDNPPPDCSAEASNLFDALVQMVNCEAQCCSSDCPINSNEFNSNE